MTTLAISASRVLVRPDARRTPDLPTTEPKRLRRIGQRLTWFSATSTIRGSPAGWTRQTGKLRLAVQDRTHFRG